MMKNNPPPFRHPWAGIGLSLLLMTAGLTACGINKPPKPAASPVPGGVGLNALTLRRTDNQGRPLWQIEAKTAKYQNNQGQVQSLVGQLYEAGKPVFRLQSPTAQIRQQGDQLLIVGSTTVTDLRGKGVLTAQEFLWRPATGTLIARQQPKLVYPVVQVTANEMQADSRQQQVLALGKVQADSPLGLRLLTERLNWQIPQARLMAGASDAGSNASGNPGVRLFQLTGSGKGNTAEGDTLSYDLKTQAVQLQSSQSVAQIQLVQSKLTITGQSFTWQIPQQRLASDRPLAVRSGKSAVNVTANSGTLDLATEKAVLNGNVRAIGQKQQSVLTTDQLTWLIPTQRVEAVGNVLYQQQQPRFTVRGGRAIGLIDEQQVSVSGGGVVTEIQM
jgi:lipopolysaccharide assembly outer membrane protein LptD (OstA)